MSDRASVGVLSAAVETARRMDPLGVSGVVAAVRGMSVLVDELPVPVGSLVRIVRAGSGEAAVPAEVVGFADGRAIVMLLGAAGGLRPGDRAISVSAAPMVRVGEELLGRVVDGLCRPVDGKPLNFESAPRLLDPAPTPALRRARITKPLAMGVRSVDAMTTIGRGQRMGIFAGPGVGKSTLLGDMARRGGADVNVIALIGERGREVREFIEHNLGAEGLARSAVFVATGDESPLMRIRAAKSAAAAAEHFRESGRDVLLMMDSITRFAHAQRQIGLAVGEPPTTKGYTPSVFAQLASLLERAGAMEGGGSITGLYTILVEGDDMTEPIADAARGILDGHLILSRKLAQKAHFPAVDVLDSVSRVADDIIDAEHGAARRVVLRSMAMYREVEDLVRIGAYARGSGADTDAAVEFQPAIEAFLRQERGAASDFAQTRRALLELAAGIAARVARKPTGRAA